MQFYVNVLVSNVLSFHSCINYILYGSVHNQHIFLIIQHIVLTASDFFLKLFSPKTSKATKA